MNIFLSRLCSNIRQQNKNFNGLNQTKRRTSNTLTIARKALKYVMQVSAVSNPRKTTKSTNSSIKQTDFPYATGTRRSSFMIRRPIKRHIISRRTKHQRTDIE